VTVAREKGDRLSVILPAYNEAALLGASLDRLRAHLEARREDWEVLVVDDGSTDNTARIVRAAAAAEARIRLVALGCNQGKGAALSRGVGESLGSVLAVTDADLSYALGDLDAAVAAVRGGVDLAAGSRVHPESRIALPFSLLPYFVRRWVMGQIFRACVRLLFGLHDSDTQCGLKAFSRDAARILFGRLRTRRFLADIEIFLAAEALGMKIAQVPVHLSHLSRASSVGLIRDFPGTVADLGRIKAAQNRGHYRESTSPTEEQVI
jgi:dolichyl-phosphate beta-glucosyltransferase